LPQQFGQIWAVNLVQRLWQFRQPLAVRQPHPYTTAFTAALKSALVMGRNIENHRQFLPAIAQLAHECQLRFTGIGNRAGTGRWRRLPPLFRPFPKLLPDLKKEPFELAGIGIVLLDRLPATG
jgi:hypothetical protein